MILIAIVHIITQSEKYYAARNEYLYKITAYIWRMLYKLTNEFAENAVQDLCGW